MDRQYIFGVAAALSVVFLWSGWMVVSRLGVSSTLTVYDVAGLRFGVGTLAALPFIIRYRCWRGLTPFKILALSGGAGIPYTLLCFLGFTFAPVSHAGVFINGCLPISTAVVAWFWIKQSSHVSQLLGMAIILIGATLVGYEGFVNQQGAQTWIGDLLFLGATVLFGIFMVASKVWRINPGQIVFSVTVLGGLIYVPVWLLALESNLAMAPWPEILLQSAYQGILASIGGISCTMLAIRYLGANLVSAYMAGVPVISSLMAIPFLGEMPGLPAWIGMVGVTLGVLLALGLFIPHKARGTSA